MWQDTVEVLTYPTVTERGRTVPDYTATPTAVSISGVDVQPGSSAELQDADRREGVQIRWTVYIKGNPSLTGHMRYLGRVFKVEGEPLTWGGPMAHRVVSLVDWQ